MTYALETTTLGRRYRDTWALRDCTLALPEGRVAALVGPNGAGKTTLLHLAVGLLQPSAGDVMVFGHSPQREPLAVLPRIGFVAQDHPLYKGFTVADMLTLGRKLNPRWDDNLARKRLQRLGIPLDRRVGKLSGGQQAQVALGMAVAKRPELLLLDEPVASLDPLARREFLRALLDATTEGSLTVLLSSHILTDLEQVCDYLIILSASRVQLAGDIAQVRRAHRVLTGPRSAVAALPTAYTVVEDSSLGQRATLLVRSDGPADGPLAAGCEVREASLEEIVLGYLGQPGGAVPVAPALEPLARGGEVAR